MRFQFAIIPILTLALSPLLGLRVADAQSASATADETFSFTDSRPYVASEEAGPDATGSSLQLAPMSMDNVYVGDVVPDGGYAEITPPPPRLLALTSFARRNAGSRALPVNSNFGVRRDPINGSARMHTGVDLQAAYGQSVGASLGGAVLYASYRGGYGNLVILDHGHGISTFYAHLSSIAVALGQRVVPGQTIGYVGSTGRSTGPHLHYEVRARGHALDPSSVITFKGSSVFANGRLVDGPTAEGGDGDSDSTAKSGATDEAAPAPLPLFQSDDSLSNY